MKNFLILLFIAAILAGGGVVSHNYFDELRNGGPSGKNLIANSALEHPQPKDAKMPYGWQNGHWGDNRANFSYLENGGINGTRAVEISLSRYRTGDAKWYFDYIGVRGGERYRFSDWYRSDVNSTITLYTDKENLVLDLVVPPAENWTRVEITFAMPIGATRAAVFHLLASNGNLTTDNYCLAPVGFEETDRGFRSGMISLVFSGGQPQTYWEAAKTIGMEPYYWKAVFYAPPKFASDTVRYYPDGRFIDRIAWFGNEIGLDNTNLENPNDTKKTKEEIGIAKTRWQVTGPVIIPRETDLNSTSFLNMSDFETNLGFENGPNKLGEFDRYDLRSVDGDTMDAAEFEKIVSQALAERYWLIIRYRGIPPKDHLDWLLANKIDPVLLSDALSEIDPQLPD